MKIAHEFRSLATKFVATHLPFLDRNWRNDVLDGKLAELLTKTVEEHTSATNNTVLREAAKQAVGLVDHALRHMPSGARECRCRELDDGDHRPQPICHVCAIYRIKAYAADALEGKAHP